MQPRPIKLRRTVSRGVIIFAVVALSPLFLWGVLSLCTQLSYWPIRSEITRIAKVSGIKPLSVECDSGIDIGTVCSALYDELSYDAHSKMLADSGYTIEHSSDDGSGYIDAINSKVHIEATGSPGYQGSSYEGKTSITYQLNDHLY